MKRIAILMFTALLSLAAAAAPIRYFTKSQATRTVKYLNAQKELMIYCGYDYEIETYVLLNEVWAERVNSSYYELWVFGYDAYTGEEIYMPLDLQCVWLYSAGRMYSAAQYLRFYTTARVPQLTWYVPAYHPYTRVVHRAGYVRTYHYDVHCYGWMPPAPPRGGYGPGTPPPMHPYYMRHPHAPAPRPVAVWTPGVDRPHVTVPDAAGRTDAPRSGATTVTTRPSAQPSGTARTGSSTSRSNSTGTATGTTSRSIGTATGTTSRNSGTATGTTSRSTGTATGTTSRSTGTATGTTSRSTGTATGTTSRSTGTAAGTTPTRSNTSAAASKSRSTTSRAASDDNDSGTTTSRSSSSRSNNSGTTTSRSSSSRSNNSGTSTSRSSSSRSNNSGTSTSRSSSSRSNNSR